MTPEQLVSAIRALPVPERLRVLTLATHDIAVDASAGRPEAPVPAPGVGVALIERRGFLVAHSESGGTLPEEVFDPRLDRVARAELLWGGS